MSEEKKVVFEENMYNGLPVSKCPACDEPIDKFYKQKKVNYCPFCGQKLLWNDDEDSDE